jgi:hypothetical protein
MSEVLKTAHRSRRADTELRAIVANEVARYRAAGPRPVHLDWRDLGGYELAFQLNLFTFGLIDSRRRYVIRLRPIRELAHESMYSVEDWASLAARVVWPSRVEFDPEPEGIP